MAEEFLDRVYKITTQEETNQLYADWAETYDKEVIAEGYITPERCAAALRDVLALDAPILDMGCGTGYSGLHLRDAGFTQITGSDPVSEMLEIADRRGVYAALWKTDLDDPFPFEPGQFAAITAIGVISVGAGPPELLAAALNALAVGGLICFSLNAYAMADPRFPGAVDQVLADGLAESVFDEVGTHMTVSGVQSRVIILRRI